MGRSKQPARRTLADLMKPKAGTYQVHWHWRDSGERGYNLEVKARLRRFGYHQEGGSDDVQAPAVQPQLERTPTHLMSGLLDLSGH